MVSHAVAADLGARRELPVAKFTRENRFGKFSVPNRGLNDLNFQTAVLGPVEKARTTFMPLLFVNRYFKKKIPKICKN